METPKPEISTLKVVFGLSTDRLPTHFDIVKYCKDNIKKVLGRVPDLALVMWLEVFLLFRTQDFSAMSLLEEDLFYSVPRGWRSRLLGRASSTRVKKLFVLGW